jgi:voltage-gated potassium channel
MTGRAIWFPILAWQEVTDAFREKIQKSFSAPMLVMALLVLPLFAVEHYWQKQIEANPTLADLTALATGLIWFAFTLEFMVMISIEEKRLEYCRKHWIDLAVICLPMIAFMRALRLAQLSKTARVFRLKSLVMKLYRALLVLEVINRILQRNPEKRIARLEIVLAEKESEIEGIKAEIAFLSEKAALKALPADDNVTSQPANRKAA